MLWVCTEEDQSVQLTYRISTFYMVFATACGDRYSSPCAREPFLHKDIRGVRSLNYSNTSRLYFCMAYDSSLLVAS